MLRRDESTAGRRVSSRIGSDRIGVGRDYVGDLESGQFGLQVTRLMRLLGELGVDVVLTLPQVVDESESANA